MNQSFELNNESQLICQYFYCITFVSLYNPTDNLKDIYHIYHRFETLTNGVHEFLKAFKLGDTRIFDKIFSRFEYIRFNLFMQIVSIFSFSHLKELIKYIFILLDISYDNAITKQTSEYVLWNISSDSFMKNIYPTSLIPYPMKFDDFVQYVQVHKSATESLRLIEKNIRNILFSNKLVKDILKRPNLIMKRESYLLSHNNQPPNCLESLCNMLFDSPINVKYDYEVDITKRNKTCKAIFDNIMIMLKANSTVQNPRIKSAILSQTGVPTYCEAEKRTKSQTCVFKSRKRSRIVSSRYNTINGRINSEVNISSNNSSKQEVSNDKSYVKSNTLDNSYKPKRKSCLSQQNNGLFIPLNPPGTIVEEEK